MSACPVPSPFVSTDVWLSQAEALAVTNWTDRWLRVKADKGEVIYRSGPKAANGKATRLFLAASLPLPAQQKLAAQAPPAPSPLAIAPMFALPGFTPEAEPVRAAIVNEDDRAEAERCLAIIQPLLDFKRDRSRFAQLRLASGAAITSLDALATYICEVHPGESLSRPTLWRWKAAYEKDGLAGLAPKRRSDKGRSRWAAANRDLADLAAHIYLGDRDQPAQSITVAHEQVCRLAAAKAVEPPSYETLRCFLDNPAEVSASMKALQHRGRKGYDAMFAPYLKRGYTEPANQIWVSDHMICDVLVQDDVFEKDLRHCRIQMTTIMDYRSRMAVGVSWCRNGSSHSIKRALLQAILRYGPPEIFYCDNGKDYQKVAQGAQRYELEAAALACVEEVRALDGSVMRRLGIESVFCLPFHPQSKHIEKYHRFFHERFDRAFPSYTAGATHLRPDATVENLAQHKKLLVMGDTRTSALPLASEYIQMAEAWIEREYHQRPMSEKVEGMNGRSPAECFAQELNPNQKPAPPLETLAGLMAETKRLTVRNCAVELGGNRFVPSYDDPHSAFVLHQQAGQKVVLAYDPLDLSRAAVLDLDGYPLCKLERQELTRFSHDAETQAAIAGISQQRGMLHKADRESIAALGRRVRGSGNYTSQVDQLRQLAALPATGTDSIVQRVRKTPAPTVSAPTYVSEAVNDFFSERTK